MQPHVIDPLADSRWNDLVASHPKASVFHHPGWLTALAKTYNYRTLAVTSAPPGEPLTDGVVFCEVKSWITGSRLVSLPFTDHAEPLLSDAGERNGLADWMRSEFQKHKWRYIELRPLSAAVTPSSGVEQSQSFWLHTLDLAPSTEKIFEKLHKSCLQRRIIHAGKQQLAYERGCSDTLLTEFYRLLMITRRRFRLLPQPRKWFQNLVEYMRPNVEIRVARKGGTAVAAILTLRHRGTVVYKFGCSDHAYHHLAAMPFLFWKLIEESKSENREEIDFGRTDVENVGLVRFKDRFGTSRRKLNYYRYAEQAREKVALHFGPSSTRALFSALPNALSSRAGGLVYRHIG
jgi:CelD/BcsL family acetyltransferase involved in cellulose biosynthesis